VISRFGTRRPKLYGTIRVSRAAPPAYSRNDGTLLFLPRPGAEIPHSSEGTVLFLGRVLPGRAESVLARAGARCDACGAGASMDVCRSNAAANLISSWSEEDGHNSVREKGYGK